MKHKCNKIKVMEKMQEEKIKGVDGDGGWGLKNGGKITVLLKLEKHRK